MTASDKQNVTRDKILNTALELIKKEGFEAITIRKIATQSDTNISLVNYYFGSKDKLISEAIRSLLSGFQESFTILDDMSLSPKERLKQFLTDYVKVISQYPELISKIIALGNTTFTSQYEYGQFLRMSGFDKVSRTLSEMTNESNPDRLMMMIMQIFGAIFLPELMKPLIVSGTGVNVSTTEQQIELLFERYFQ
ncbi:MAG TPA: TetR/AcrR family transcriptional regulator [Paenibacillus sp.]